MRPSSTSATASHAAPASTAARATGTAPWPYPSALTTAHISAGSVVSTRAATLWVTAPRSMSAHVGRIQHLRQGGQQVRCNHAMARGDLCGTSVHPCAGGGGMERVEALRQERADDARQHV